MATRKRRPAAPHAAQVQAETGLRFGPQEFALAQALRQAVTDRNFSVGTARATGAGLQHAVDLAAPVVQGGYQQASAATNRASSDVASALSGLGAGADPFRALQAREAGGAQQRLASALADATKELGQRKVDAASGTVQSVQNAIRGYQTTVSKLQDQQQQVAGQAGTYASARSGQLAQADQLAHAKVVAQTRSFAHSRAQQSRGQRFSEKQLQERQQFTAEQNARKQAAADRKAQKAGLGTLPNGKKPLSLEQHNALRDKVDAAVNVARTLASGNKPVRDWQTMVQFLQQGSPGFTDKVLNKDGTTSAVHRPAIPAYTKFIAKIAADLVLHGGVSAPIHSLANDRGYSVKALGLKVLRPQPLRRPPVAGTPKSAGGVRPT